MKKPEAYKCWEGAWEGAMLELHELTKAGAVAAESLPVGCSTTYPSIFKNQEGLYVGTVQKIGDGDTFVSPLPTFPGCGVLSYA
jgi:hypothetical protein